MYLSHQRETLQRISSSYISVKVYWISSIDIASAGFYILSPSLYIRLAGGEVDSPQYHQPYSTIQQPITSPFPYRLFHKQPNHLIHPLQLPYNLPPNPLLHFPTFVTFHNRTPPIPQCQQLSQSLTDKIESGKLTSPKHHPATTALGPLSPTYKPTPDSYSPVPPCELGG